MRKDVCSFCASYQTEEIWYDDEAGIFLVDRYHCGAIDDEQFFDGTRPIDTFTALTQMIRNNKLRAVLMYYDALHGARDLDAALAGLKQSSAISDFTFLGDPRLKYYKTGEDEYAIYFEGTFFSVKNGETGAADFTVVRRILENHQTAAFYEYDPRENTWSASNIMDVPHL